MSDAIERAAHGLIDADLGGGIIKLRVARQGHGRSGGYRMLVAYRAGTRAVFLYAFAKNERESIGPDGLLAFRQIGAAWLEAEAPHLAQALEDGRLQEMTNDEDNQT